MEKRQVRSADGVTLAVEVAGSPSAPPIVFLHGIAQSGRVWRPALEGALATRHRLLAVDMRGHGDSDAPADAEAYATGDRLGADLHAVLSELKLTRPLVVAWSYGGVMLGEYLRHHGGDALGGILFLAAAVKVGRPARALFGPGMMDHARALLSDDSTTYEAGARAFLAGCAAPSFPMGDDFLDDGVKQMLRVPVHVRRALLTRSEDYTSEIATCAAPMATLHGTADSVVLPAMSAEIEALGGTVTPGRAQAVGHLPWLEAPDAFARALEALSARVIEA